MDAFSPINQTCATHGLGNRMGRGPRHFSVCLRSRSRRSAVLGLVVGQGLRIAVSGVAVGIIVTLFVTRLLATLLYGVAPHDPAIFAGVALSLAAVGAVASLLPARRATHVDPLTALRTE